MTDEVTRAKIADWHKRHPVGGRLAKLLLLAGFLVLLGFGIYRVTESIHEGHWLKIIGMALFIALSGWRTYRKQSKAISK
ncbi:MAG TPA: hypothetical protein VF463_15800 [Sphingobium sp.]